jgi:hypothetical protein
MLSMSGLAKAGQKSAGFDIDVREAPDRDHVEFRLSPGGSHGFGTSPPNRASIALRSVSPGSLTACFP